MSAKSIIINPSAERNAEEQRKARKMDIINLARSIVHFHPKISAPEAFDISEAFVKEQDKRYPPDTTKPVGDE